MGLQNTRRFTTDLDFPFVFDDPLFVDVVRGYSHTRLHSRRFFQYTHVQAIMQFAINLRATQLLRPGQGVIVSLVSSQQRFQEFRG